MGDSRTPALLILGTPYVKRDGAWYKEGTMQLAVGQCQELDRLYRECGSNGRKTRGRADRLGIPELSDVTVIDEEEAYRLPEEAARDEDHFLETFEEGFRDARDCRFRNCTFKERALSQSYGVVATNCRFEDMALCRSERAFVHGKIYKLGSVKDSVVVMEPLMVEGRPVHMLPEGKNPGSLVVLYGVGVVGGGDGLFAVDERDIRGKRLSEWSLAKRLLKLDMLSISDFPDWFLEKYLERKRPYRKRRKLPDARREPAREELTPEEAAVRRQALEIRQRREGPTMIEGGMTPSGSLAARDFIADYEADPTFEPEFSGDEPEKARSYLEEGTLRFLGQANLMRSRKGETLLDFRQHINRKLKAMGYPVREDGKPAKA